jgi:hypothetical protein
MRKFVAQLFFRLVIILVLGLSVFFIRWNKKYYTDIPNGTQYGKATWVYNKLDTLTVDQNTVVFFGSSMMERGMNDSMLSENGSVRYVNLAIPEPCNVLVYDLLQKVLKKGKPKKIYFTLKCVPTTGIHPIWSIIEDPSAIIASIANGNFSAFRGVFYHVGWNLNYLTRFMKDDIKYAPPYVSKWGHVAPVSKLTQAQWEDSYDDRSRKFSKMLENQEILSRGEKLKEPEGVLQLPRKYWQRLYQWNTRKIRNADYQDFILNESCKACEAAGVDYGFIFYPPPLQVAAKKSYVTVEYYQKRILKNVDPAKHRILYYEPESLNNRDCWEDIDTHLSEKGSFIYTTEFMKDSLK